MAEYNPIPDYSPLPGGSRYRRRRPGSPEAASDALDALVAEVGGGMGPMGPGPQSQQAPGARFGGGAVSFPRLNTGGMGTNPAGEAGKRMAESLMQPRRHVSAMDKGMAAVSGFTQGAGMSSAMGGGGAGGEGGGGLGSLFGGAAGGEEEGLNLGAEAGATPPGAMPAIDFSSLMRTPMDMTPTGQEEMGVPESGFGAAEDPTAAVLPPEALYEPGSAGEPPGPIERTPPTPEGVRVGEFPHFPRTPSGGIVSKEALDMLVQAYKDRRHPEQMYKNVGRIVGMIYGA